MSRLIFANDSDATNRYVYFHLVDATDGITAETGEAGGQPQISTNGAGFSNTGIGTLVSIGNGRYYAELTQGAIATAGDVIETRYKSANTAECPGDQVQVLGINPYATAIRAVDSSGNDIAPAATALTNATWTDGRAGKLDNLDATVSSRPTASAVADAVWEEQITDHSGTAGSTAEALSGVTVVGTVDANIVSSAITLDSNVVSMDADTVNASALATDAVTEIAAAIVIPDPINANLVEINGDSITDNLATLRLKSLDIHNSSGAALSAISSSVSGVYIEGAFSGLRIDGGTIDDTQPGIAINGGANAPAISALAGGGDNAGAYIRGSGSGLDLDARNVNSLSVNVSSIDPNVLTASALAADAVAEIAAAVTSGTTGARLVTLHSQTTGADSVPGARLSVYDAAGAVLIGRSMSTSTGDAQFNLDDGTYQVVVYKTGYEFTNPQEIVVTGDQTNNIILDPTTLPASVDPSLCTISGTMRNALGEAAPDVVLLFKALTPQSISGVGPFVETEIETTTDSSGYFEVELARNLLVLVTCEELGMQTVEKTVPDQASLAWDAW